MTPARIKIRTNTKTLPKGEFDYLVRYRPKDGSVGWSNWEQHTLKPGHPVEEGLKVQMIGPIDFPVERQKAPTSDSTPEPDPIPPKPVQEEAPKPEVKALLPTDLMPEDKKQAVLTLFRSIKMATIRVEELIQKPQSEWTVADRERLVAIYRKYMGQGRTTAYVPAKGKP